MRCNLLHLVRCNRNERCVAWYRQRVALRCPWHPNWWRSCSSWWWMCRNIGYYFCFRIGRWHCSCELLSRCGGASTQWTQTQIIVILFWSFCTQPTQIFRKELFSVVGLQGLHKFEWLSAASFCGQLVDVVQLRMVEKGWNSLPASRYPCAFSNRVLICHHCKAQLKPNWQIVAGCACKI